MSGDACTVSLVALSSGSDELQRSPCHEKTRVLPSGEIAGCIARLIGTACEAPATIKAASTPVSLCMTYFTAKSGVFVSILGFDGLKKTDFSSHQRDQSLQPRSQNLQGQLLHRHPYRRPPGWLASFQNSKQRVRNLPARLRHPDPHRH